MTKHPIDKIFEEKLKDFEQMPRAAVWDKLNAQLDQKRPIVWWKRKAVWWSTGLSVTFLTIGLALWRPQVAPLPAQTAAKMVSLQMKLKGMPLDTRLTGKPAPRKVDISKNYQENKTVDKTFTQNLALNTSGNDSKNVKQTDLNQPSLNQTNVTQPKNEPKDKPEKSLNAGKVDDKIKASLPVPNIQPVQVNVRRKKLSRVDLLPGAQGLKLAGENNGLQSQLPQPKAQPKIVVTLKLSENMAGSREQDEPQTGLKRIWNKIKGRDQQNKNNKKTKKKRSGILKFLGDRDD